VSIQDNKAKNLLFVIYFMEGYIGIAPTVLGLTRELTALGHHVHIRTVATKFPAWGDLPASCRVVNFSRPRDHRLLDRFCNLLFRIKLGTLIPVFDLLWFSLQSLLLDLKLRTKQPGLRRVNIGIDPGGAILAWVHSRLWHRGFVYLSLELVSPKTYRRFSKLVPWLEGKALKQAAGIIIQDAERLRTLSQYHAGVSQRAFFLPNSTRAATAHDKLSRSGNYFRKKFNLDPQCFPYIALQAGMIEDEVYAQELAKAFTQINSGFALVFHERLKRSINEPYIQLLRNHNSRNLFLSLDPVPFDQVDRVFASATIGLALYRPIDENFAQNTLSSGKLSFYLKHGIPVLMNSLPSADALNQRYQIGVVVQDPTSHEELAAALNSIMARYDFYSSNARRCFREQFDFGAKFEPVLAFLESL
jgi:hypothetical protein